MPTILKDKVTAGSVTFNDPTANPEGAIDWGMDTLDGWDDSSELDVVSTPIGGGADGEISARVFSARGKYLLASGWAMAGSRADAEALIDVLLGDAFPRDTNITLTRYEVIPKYMTVRVASKRSIARVGPYGWRWTVTLLAEDPFRYDATPPSDSQDGPNAQPTTAAAWESGTVYYEGDVVSHSGNIYRANQDILTSESVNMLSAGASEFETDTGGWINYEGSPTITRDTSEHHSGAASLKLVATTTGPTAIYHSPQISLTNGHIYKLSFWAKTSVTRNVRIDMTTTGIVGGYTGSPISVPAGTWTYVSRTWTMSATETTGEGIYLVSPAIGDVLWIDDVRLVEISTAFPESKFDLVNYAEATVVNRGGIATRNGVITVTGPAPAGGWHVENGADGSSMAFDVDLVDTDTLTIDMKSQNAYLNGELVTTTLIGDFFRFYRGSNPIRLFAPVDSDTTISASIKSAWE